MICPPSKGCVEGQCLMRKGNCCSMECQDIDDQVFQKGQCDDETRCCAKPYTCMRPRGGQYKMCVGPADGVSKPIECSDEPEEFTAATFKDHCSDIANAKECKQNGCSNKGGCSFKANKKVRCKA